MRIKRSSILSLGLLAVTAIGAELVISSFNQNGELTWTNSISSNATYRVEWAGKATGPWNKFDALTNLTLLSATSSTVTVTVPTFYRVVWLDPPPPEPQGTWDYKSYDQQSVLIVTGRLSMVIQTNWITGTWNLQRTANPTRAHFGEQFGTGILEGWLTGNDLFVNLNPRNSDDNVILRGQMVGTNWTGTWEYDGLFGVEPGGKVELVKQ